MFKIQNVTAPDMGATSRMTGLVPMVTPTGVGHWEAWITFDLYTSGVLVVTSDPRTEFEFFEALCFPADDE